MAWSWSHTNEAYANAQANLEELPLETLRVIEAEWRARRTDEFGWNSEFSVAKYNKAMAAIKRENYSAQILAESIWEKASEQATCDNGGYNAWMCPFGCHTVSFDNPLREEWELLRQDGSTHVTFEQYKAVST